MTTTRLSRRALEALREELSDRDLAVLESVAAHRFLTTRHIERLHFSEHATPLAAARSCRRTLMRLHELHVLHRLARRVGGVRAGSASYVWSVGVAGDGLLRIERGLAPRRHQDEPSLTFLRHTLAVADAHLALVEADRRNAFELIEVQTEPASWRGFTSTAGTEETLRPDLYAVTASGDYEDHWFIEVDCGTESLPVLLRKCGIYESYRRSGLAQAQLGTFPLVIWQLPNDERVRRLATALTEAADRFDAALYRLATPEQLAGAVAAPHHYVIERR